MQRLIARGQKEDAFDPRLPSSWLAATVIALSHTAGDEVGADRMSADVALSALRRTVGRVLGVDQFNGSVQSNGPAAAQG